MAERMCAVPTHSHANSTFLLHSGSIWFRINWWILFLSEFGWKKEQSFSVEILEFLTDSKWLCVSWEKYNGQMNSSQLLLWYVSKITTNCQIFKCHNWKQPYCLPFNLPCDSASLSVHGSSCSTLMLVFMTMSELTNNMRKGVFKKMLFGRKTGWLYPVCWVDPGWAPDAHQVLYHFIYEVDRRQKM